MNQSNTASGSNSIGRTLVAGVLSIVVLLVVTSHAATVEVTVGNDAPTFDPSSIAIQPGDTVAWNVVETGFTHDIASGAKGKSDALFRSPAMTEGSFSYTSKDTQATDIQATGVAPTNDLESALIATREPGSYTPIVSDKNGAVGVGLVELFNLQ